MSDYWKIWAESAFDEADISATPEQLAKVVKSVEFAHDDYGSQHGHDEADKSLLRIRREEAMKDIFRFVEEQFCFLDCGPSFYDSLNDTQKTALAKLLHIREEFSK